MKKKKICAITTISATLEGFAIPALRLMAKKGYDITLVSAMTEDFIKRYSLEFTCINVNMKRGISLFDSLFMPFIFCRIFKQGGYDLVQYATPNASLYASLGAKMALVPKRVYCQWGIRYVGAGGFMRWLLKLMEHLTCTLSTHIRPASWKNLDFAVGEGLYKREKAAAIGDGGTIGVELNDYDLSKKNTYREEIKRLYPRLHDKLVFCYVGRFDIDKGCFELIEAFKKLALERENIMLLMVSYFENEPPEDYKWIIDAPNIVMTGKHVSDVYRYMAASDILVHPSYREGFSMVIQEAMAMEVPVVTTDIPGPSEVIEPNVSGILAKPRDIETLYECMKWMVDHPVERTEMGKAGRRRCEEKFNRERMLRLTLEDREQILNS